MSESLREKIENARESILKLRDSERKFLEGEILLIDKLKGVYDDLNQSIIILDELLKYRSPYPNYFKTVESILDEILNKIRNLYEKIGLRENILGVIK